MQKLLDTNNSFHPSINTTYNTSLEKFNFLDVTVIKSEDKRPIQKMKEPMFPEINVIIREQLRDEIRTFVRDALNEATKSLNGEITNLNSQNNTHHCRDFREF